MKVTIPHDLLSRPGAERLKEADLRVYIAIASVVKPGSDWKESSETLAKMAGVSDRSFRRALGKLIEMNLVQAHRTARGWTRFARPDIADSPATGGQNAGKSRRPHVAETATDGRSTGHTWPKYRPHVAAYPQTLPQQPRSSSTEDAGASASLPRQGPPPPTPSASPAAGDLGSPSAGLAEGEGFLEDEVFTAFQATKLEKSGKGLSQSEHETIARLWAKDPARTRRALEDITGSSRTKWSGDLSRTIETFTENDFSGKSAAKEKQHEKQFAHERDSDEFVSAWKSRNVVFKHVDS